MPTKCASVSAISLRHILASLCTPWDNRGKCYMDGKRIQCLSKASQHVPIYLQPVIQHFLHILASTWYASGTIAVKLLHGWNENSMLVKRIATYPSIFNRLRAIARYWSEIATFSYHLYLTPLLGVFPLEFREKVWSSEN